MAIGISRFVVILFNLTTRVVSIVSLSLIDLDPLGPCWIIDESSVSHPCPVYFLQLY